MSSSISAAKKRRANISQAPSPQIQQPQQQQTSAKPMTLPQVLKILDSRLSTLEKSAKDTVPSESVNSNIVVQEETNAIKEILNEYDERFQMLAGEIQEMKSALMKLQTYTMDVNKTLLEERVQYMNTPSSTVNPSINYDNIIANPETIEMKDANVESTPENLSEENDNNDNEVLNEESNNDQSQMTEEEKNDTGDDFEVSFSTHDKKMKKKGRK
mgnify:CR=1 FL=1